MGRPCLLHGSCYCWPVRRCLLPLPVCGRCDSNQRQVKRSEKNERREREQEKLEMPATFYILRGIDTSKARCTGLAVRL